MAEALADLSAPMYTIALTPGEPAGIGPDLCISLACAPPPGARIVVIGDPAMLVARGQALGRPIRVREWPQAGTLAQGSASGPVAGAASRAADMAGATPVGTLDVFPIRAAAPVTPGRLDPANARHVLDTITAAVRGCVAGTFDALHFQFVTNPELPQEHPPYDVWCTADGEFLFLRGQVAGYMQTHYELGELSRGPFWAG
jgi:4-hydroxy-L-threonine phosphate dehydrogenase PdxA